MSFYGQVLYEFSRLFSKINIENDNSESAVAEDPTGQDSLAPTEEWDQLNLVGGNRWIQLNSNKDNKTITISHAAPGATDNSKTIISFSPVDEVPEGATCTELPAGAIVQASTGQYDAAGHAKTSTTSYFKLPANKTEQDLTAITQRVAQLEDTYVAEDEFNNKTETYLTTNQYIQNEEFNTKVQDYLNENKYIHGQDLEENETYTTTKITGVLDEMYPEGETYSLAKTVGIMSGEDSFVDNLEKTFTTPYAPKATYTISEAINVLSQAINSLQADVQGVKISHSELLILTHDLRTRIDSLEAELNKLKTPTE